MSRPSFKDARLFASRLPWMRPRPRLQPQPRASPSRIRGGGGPRRRKPEHEPVWDVIQTLESSFRWIDLLDVGIVAFIVYRVLLLIKGTRAMQMLTGLGILGIGFYISSAWELFTTHWLLSYFFDYLILIVIVLFQDDLRRALTHVGKNPFFSAASEEGEGELV